MLAARKRPSSKGCTASSWQCRTSVGTVTYCVVRRSGVALKFFAAALGAGKIDTLVDFNVADDRFLLSDAIITELDTGRLSRETFRTGLAQDASGRILYETGTGKLVYDKDGTGAVAGIQFATITANLALTGADFSVE